MQCVNVSVCGVIFVYDAINTEHNFTLAACQDRENPLDNVLLYSLRRAGSVEMLEHSGDEDERRTSRKSPPDDVHPRTSCLPSFTQPTIPSLHSSLLSASQSIIITLFSKLPYRLLTSLHLVLHSLLHPAHLYFHTATLANNPPISPVSSPPPPGPSAFHPHHHPLSSSLLSRSRTPRTDLLLFFLLLFHLLSSLCSPSLVIQPGEHGEEESEDPAEEAHSKETSSAGPAGERAY